MHLRVLVVHSGLKTSCAPLGVHFECQHLIAVCLGVVLVSSKLSSWDNLLHDLQILSNQLTARVWQPVFLSHSLTSGPAPGKAQVSVRLFKMAESVPILWRWLYNARCKACQQCLAPTAVLDNVCGLWCRQW